MPDAGFLAKFLPNNMIEVKNTAYISEKRQLQIYIHIHVCTYTDIKVIYIKILIDGGAG